MASEEDLNLLANIYLDPGTYWSPPGGGGGHPQTERTQRKHDTTPVQTQLLPTNRIPLIEIAPVPFEIVATGGKKKKKKRRATATGLPSKPCFCHRSRILMDRVWRSG